MKIHLKKFTASLLTLLALSTNAQPVLSESKIKITFTQMGVPVEATFHQFSAAIQYDAAKPAAASAQFTIDIRSFDLGSPEYNQEVLKPVWFDAAKYPVASFKSTQLKVVSPTQLEVTGSLTIKGKTQNVRVPVQVKNTDTTQNFDGQLKIQRTAFGIGTGEWEDTSLVADEVTIRVNIVNKVNKVN